MGSQNVRLSGLSVEFGPDGSAQSRLGSVVQRSAKILPQSATEPLFTVSGGRVMIVQILGEVTTVIQTQACNLKLNANPTVGTSVDICADLNISALAVGILLGITGTFATAMAQGLALVAQASPTVVSAGTIDAITSASNTGGFKWTVRYVPIDDGATLVAA